MTETPLITKPDEQEVAEDVSFTRTMPSLSNMLFLSASAAGGRALVPPPARERAPHSQGQVPLFLTSFRGGIGQSHENKSVVDILQEAVEITNEQNTSIASNNHAGAARPNGLSSRRLDHFNRTATCTTRQPSGHNHPSAQNQ